jgi:hypothetical protein
MTSNATPCLVNVTSNSNGIVLTSSTVTPTVAISANPGTTICNGTSVTFTANATNGGSSPSYQWRRNGLNVGTNSPTFISATLVTNDSISVELTSNATCISTPNATSAASVMTVNAVPIIIANTSTSRCGTGTVVLAATASAGNVNWYSALTGGTSLDTGSLFTTPSIAVTTTYFVDATANGCTTAARTSIDATVNALPIATATAATTPTLCAGDSLLITANTGTGLTYQWLNNNAPIVTATSISYIANAAGNYRVLVGNASGCKDTSTAVAVIVNPKPITATIIGRNSVHSDTVEIYSVNNTIGSSYIWTVLGGLQLTGGSTNSITVDWDVAYTSGMVNVIETNTFGCKGDTVFKPIISIVPVEFLSFDAKRVNERVNLTWVTASEINNSHFDVERSIDNNRFEFIGTVKGNGTTSLVNTYRLVDNIKSLINTNVTTVYYRLKQVDYDGEFAYTDVRTVELNNLDAVELTVYPNPNYGVFNLSVKSTEKLITTFTIYDNIGAEVWSYTTTLEQGLNTIPAQLQLAKGMYNVSMLNNKGIQTQRFIVK